MVPRAIKTLNVLPAANADQEYTYKVRDPRLLSKCSQFQLSKVAILPRVVQIGTMTTRLFWRASDPNLSAEEGTT